MAGLYAGAQSSEAEIRARLLHTPLLLRQAWDGNTLRFDAQGQPLEVYKNLPFTLAGVEWDKVSFKNGELVLKGHRWGLAFDKTGKMLRFPLAPVTVEVEAPAGSNLAPALDALFTVKFSQVPSACSYAWATYGQGRWLPPEPSQPTPTYLSGLAPLDPAGKALGAVKPPKVLRQVDPAFSQAAKQAKFSGDVELGFRVETDGSVSHVRIIRAAGLGLDEEAIAALMQYRFAPATKDDVPVSVEIRVDVNFQLF